VRDEDAAFRHVVLGAIVVFGCIWCVDGCSKPTSGARSSPPDAASTIKPDFLAAIAKAEDQRRAQDIPPEAQRSHDVAVRRSAARALARIGSTDDAPLLRALEDEDDEVMAWAGYGLGEGCTGHEEMHVRAVSARLASFDRGAVVSRSAGAPMVAYAAMLRALGRCGGDIAERTLRAWLVRGGAATDAAAYALGDLRARQGSLSSESTIALLDAAQATPPVEAALYPFGRGEDGTLREELEPRLVAAARSALDRAAPARIFAVRALGRTRSVEAPPLLARVLASDDFEPAERVEAANSLAQLRRPGQAALAGAVESLALEYETTEKLASDRFGVLLAALAALGQDTSRDMQQTLWAMARLEPPSGASSAILRRASALRCAAAKKLARGAWDSDVLHKCDVGDGEAGEHARLAALDRGALVAERRSAWLDLAHSPHLRVREEAIELIDRHPELRDSARAVLAEALSATQPGVVAAAAARVQAHPERLLVVAASARQAALDPREPAPTSAPARELDAAVARGLRAALARPWSGDLVETRVALIAAALAAGLDEGRSYARAACKDVNTTVRARAAKALASTGEKDVRCLAPAESPEPAAEIGHALDRVVRVVFDTDAGPLAVRFDPAFAPVAVTRLVALARSGFYTGIAVHRVVPGFVVQLGDRGGDGYGGSGDTLRCETSPVAFEPLDVGVALAGRDTGSSQFFVVLERYPHLDGEYAWVGRAEGDWNAVATGDMVRGVRVEE
jgi:cyclophilin family peptidyl-prolyl cis-trans isomerase